MSDSPALPSNELVVPESPDEVLADVNGFVATAASAIAALARRDGVITISEYEALLSAAEVLSSVSDHPLVVRVLVLNEFFQATDYTVVMKRLQKEAKGAPESARTAVLFAASPLLRCQPRSAGVAKEWISCLKIKSELLESFEKQLPESKPRAWFDSKTRWIRKTEDNQLSNITRLSDVFDSEELRLLVQELETGNRSVEDTNRLLTSFARAVTERTETFLLGCDYTAEQRDAAERFLKIVEIIVRQTELRLRSVHERLSFQQQLFEEDLSNFVESSVDSVELGMRDLMEGREDNQSWADDGLWRRFAETDSCRRVLSRYQPFKARYDRIFGMWSSELSGFSEELQTTAVGVLANVDPAAFATIVDTQHGTIRLANTVDKAVSAAITLSGITVVGTGVAIITGVTSVATVCTTVIVLASNPVGWIIGGTVGLAAVWKLFSDPAARRRNLVFDKKQEVRKRLRMILGEPDKEHRKSIDDIGGRFYSAASTCYAPLVRDARLSLLQFDLRSRLAERVRRDTRSLISEYIHEE
jgi:hypothetical protein